MGRSLAIKITEECLNFYNKLTKKGKPIPNKEWTSLSGIVMELEGRLSIVALATGTKCMNHNTMSPKGDIVNDSHAEVLARRCFLRYLYDQITEFQQTSSSEIIISHNSGVYEVNPKVKFHFYCSHVPCGDASIIPILKGKGEKRKFEVDDVADTKRNKNFGNKKSKVLEDCTIAHSILDSEGESEIPNQSESTSSNGSCGVIGNNSSSCHKSEDTSEYIVEGIGQISTCEYVGESLDIHRTGAKCVLGEGRDSRLPGTLYHTVGLVRTKPGRGDITLSVSCSDKLARWIACGLQGALLSVLLSRPVQLTSVVVGGGGPYSPEVLQRAIIARSGTPLRPTLLHCDLVFPHAKYLADSTARPCPAAIMWSRVSHKPLEVCVEGKRLGTTKKCKDNGRLMVCKLELMRVFLSVAGDRFKGLRYRDIKDAAAMYNNVWAQTRGAMGAWTSKPAHLEHFTLE